MASNFKVPDKKTLVAIIIIAVLVIAAIVGTVAFLKNRGTTEATDLESYNEQTTGTTQEEQQTIETQEQSGEPATQNAEEQATRNNAGTETETEVADTNSTTAGGNQSTTGTGTTGATGTTSTTQTTGGTTTTDNIQESTITREETVTIPEQLVAEGEDKTWTPRELQVAIADGFSNLSVQTPDITIKKEAITETGKDLVQQGEKITYTITVKNNSPELVEKIYVTDSIPEQTTYVQPTEAQENVPEKLTDAKGNVILRWAVSLGANEEKILQFQVTVNENATGAIENVAIVNGEETNETETSIIETEKTANIYRDGNLVNAPAKIDDEITYIIKVTNTGDISGETTIKDEMVDELLKDGKTELVGNTVKVFEDDEQSEKTIEDLKTGIKVNFNKEAKVEFTVKVKKANEKLINIATVGDVPTEEVVTDVIDFSIRKEAILSENTEIKDGKAQAGDQIEYIVYVSNEGTAKIEGLTVIDERLDITLTGINLEPLQKDKEVIRKIYLVTNADVENIEENPKIVNQAIASYDGKDKDATVNTPVEEIKGLAVDKKATKVNDGEVVPVKEGDVITYEIKVTNTGNTTLENVKVNESLQVEGNLNIGTLAPGESKTITVTYKVQKEDVNDKTELVNVVTATDGTTTSEKDEENTPVEPKVPEIDFTVVPTSTETSTVTIPQDVILVLDFSSSMTYEIDDTDVIKIDALKDAVDNFLDSFLKTEGNRVKIIEYDADIMKETEFSSDKSALDISKDKTGSGTNIDYGLTIANQYVTEDNAATTSVILMSDGSPYNYYNDDKHKVDSDSEKNTSEAIESAGWIKSKGAKLYTIGFDIRGDRDAISLMKAIATSEDTYYQTDDGKGLSGAFEEISETITTTHDGTYIPLKTVNGGKGIITKGFKEGQKVEIYTGTYGPNAVPVYTYTWDQFLNLDEVDYTNNVITFDLRTFMSNHQISEDTNVTIRFVDNAIASSRALTQFINIVVEESEEEINKIIQEIDEIEKTNTDTENIKENEKVQTDTMNKTEDNNNKVEEANTDVTNSDIKKPSTDNATKPIESEQAQGEETEPEETEPEEKQPIQDNNMLQTNQNKIAEPVKNQEKQNNEIIKIPNIDTSNVKE